MQRRQPILSEPAEALAKAGEFIGCSEMSLEQQKQTIRSKLRIPSTAESRIIVYNAIFSKNFKKNY
jgi:hypothetical protein